MEACVSEWSGRRVLVTGATGLVGSWLVRALLEKGADVVVLVRDHDPQSELYRSGDVKRASVVDGEVQELATIERALNHHRVDTVFHLAAQTQVRCAYRDPYETFESNVRGTYSLLEACRRHRDLVQRIVIASSDKAYGEAKVLPYTEDTPLEARFPYDTSKLCTDVITRSYFATYGLPAAIARCGNIYGGGDLNWDRIIPGTIRSLLRDERPLIRSDGTLVRDYVYVKEVVDAYLLLAEHLHRPEVKGEAFNFSAEKPLSVLELVEQIVKSVGVRLAPDVRGEAVAEIGKQFLSSRRAEQVLGWKSRYPLDRALGETVTWYRDFLKGTA
ncbi:MAG: NAD-dependent epimerase/dehydratase family protein [Candidatus Eisenbacteria bacterium]|uniref:NAD-dependent epimerase/dehydratase family protein n=1 Tax=Eiseniibacteriota bacterium TaxID=2212470 RepID=A0A849SGS9_UNCEI|nr:NAD-dependent epimerase/dehydratase family protein [Candidatus Eisenbacteria bacterium]